MLVAAPLASATPPPSEVPVATEAESLVQTEMLKPLAAREGKQSRFSRARLPPQARRVRVLDARPQKDEAGRAFVNFSVDVRHGYRGLDEEEAADGWRQDVMTGCVYPESKEVFVKRGGAYHPAAVVLGKKTQAAAKHVCVGDTPQRLSAK